MRKNSLIAFTLGLLAAASITGCAQQESHAGGAPRALPVRLQQVEWHQVSDTSSFVGTLKCVKSVAVRPRVEGYITQINVRSGDFVRAGAVLLEVDPAKEKEILNTQLASLESNEAEKVNAQEKLRSLKADRGAKISNLDFARSQYQRYKSLREEGAVSQESVDQLANQLKAAESELSSIDAQISAQVAVISKADKMLKQSFSQTKQERVQLAYHKVVAPFDGVVGDVPVKLGQFVETATSLTTIDETTPLEVYVYVPAEQAVRLAKGMRMTMVDNAGEAIGTCSIFFISPRVDDQNQSVMVKALYENRDGKLRSNQQVTTKIQWETGKRLLVPTNAVVRISGQDFVFVAEETKGAFVAKQRPVKLGEIYGNSYVVLSGLGGDEQIVVSSVQNLFEGAPLTPESGTSLAEEHRPVEVVPETAAKKSEPTH
jgi:multidrug efflux pump subunit AcrA (membrane-fusion protein)